MLMTRVRYPNSASLKPVAEARLVLPTPPLPLHNRILIHRLYANSRLVITLVEGLPAGGKPDAGIESVKLPPRSPNLNAYAERFVRTIKESCLDQTIFFGEDSLLGAIHEFIVHYY